MKRSTAFRDFKASLADLNYLSLSLSYIKEHENEIMDYLQRVKNLDKNQVFEEFIKVIGYISSTQNIRLRSSVEEYERSISSNKKLFSWDNIPEIDKDNKSILKFLRDDLDINWAENAKIRKTDDGKTIRIFEDGNSAEIIIDKEKEKATLKISDGRTLDFKVKKENCKPNIYMKNTWKQWVEKTPEYKIEYYPNSEKKHVLELNYLLRNYDAHSGKEDKFLDSKMTPSEILSQEVNLINANGQEIFFFTEDLSRDEIENKLGNLMNLNNELMVLLYGEYLKMKILGCITKIDESLNIPKT